MNEETAKLISKKLDEHKVSEHFYLKKKWKPSKFYIF